MAISAMARIWANRLEAGNFTWDDVPQSRKADVKTVLRGDVETGKNGMTADRYEEIVGEPYEA